MLTIKVDPGKYGQNLYLDWHDGEPVPEALNGATVAHFQADGHELALIVHAMNGDMEYMRHRLQGAPAPSPLPGAGARPRFVQIVKGQNAGLTGLTAILFALDEQGQVWSLDWIRRTSEVPGAIALGGRFVWQRHAEFEL